MRGTGIFIGGTLAVGVALAVLAQAGYGITVNVEPCLPLGNYWLVPAKPVRRGDIVQFCAPHDNPIVQFGVRRGWLGSGSCPDGTLPMLKEVAAVAGDTVTLTPPAVFINGRAIHNTASRTTTLSGQDMPHIAYGTYTVPTGQFLPLGTNSPDSFDGRYFGFLHTSVIQHDAERF